MLREDLVAIIVWLVAVITALNVVFLGFVFFRRWYKNRYYRLKDRARKHYAQVLSTMTADGEMPALAKPRGAAERDALQEMLLLHMGGLDAIRSTEMLFRFGYVDRWARKAFGRRRARVLVQQASMNCGDAVPPANHRLAMVAALQRLRLFAVPRALALDSLGRLAPDYASRFAIAGLQDPANEVRVVAMTALGRSRTPGAVPMIVELLRKGVEEEHDTSVRSAKAALIAYDIVDLDHFAPYLTHPNSQLRFVIVDVVREIAERSARHRELSAGNFPPRCYELMLEQVRHDPSPDVRARCAGVLRWFRNESATAALRVLVGDESEFVRLHAVRACGDPYYRELVPAILEHVTDQRWRVREAAVRTLAMLGPDVRHELLRTFIDTRDRFACEQIAENLQRSGVALQMLQTLGTDAAATAEAVCSKMISMGKVAMLTECINSRLPERARVRLMELLVDAPTEELVEVLRNTARKDHSRVGLRAAFLLRYARHKFATAASGAD